MLAMSAMQIGNPIVLVIPVESNYGLIHGVSYERRSGDSQGEDAGERQLKTNEGLDLSSMTSRRKGPTRKRGDHGLRLSWGG